jgi:hypothetical protein
VRQGIFSIVYAVLDNFFNACRTLATLKETFLSALPQLTSSPAETPALPGLDPEEIAAMDLPVASSSLISAKFKPPRTSVYGNLAAIRIDLLKTTTQSRQDGQAWKEKLLIRIGMAKMTRMEKGVRC